MANFLCIVGILACLLGIYSAIVAFQSRTDLKVAEKEIQRMRRINKRQEEHITDLTEELWFKEENKIEA